MRRSTKLVAMGGILTALYIIGAIGSRQTAANAADNGPTVTIGSPLPLPVSGAVAATQSGPWNVGITGTPNVNVASLPPVQLSGQPLNVSVGNSPTVNFAPGSSVLSRGLDDPGRIAFQAALKPTTNCDGLANCTYLLGPVAAGHRIVFQHVNGILIVSPSTKAVDVQIQLSSTPAFSFGLGFTAQTLTPVTGFVFFDQPVLFYLDQSQTGFISASAVAGNLVQDNQSLTVTGYELDCNVAPCSPIAQQ